MVDVLGRLGVLTLVSARQLRARVGRTILACVSLIIGILAITAIEATAGAAAEVIVHQSELVNGLAGSAMAPVQSSTVGAAAAFELVERDTAGVSVAALVTESGAAVDSGGRPIFLTGYAGDLAAIRPVRLVTGSWPSPEATLTPQILVNEEAAQRLGDGPVYLSVARGDVGRVARIQGVLHDGEFEPKIYLPWQVLRAHAQTTPETNILLLARSDSGEIGDSLAWLTAQISRFAVPLSGEIKPVGAQQGLDQTLQTIRIGFLAVGIITVIVGIMGVLNIGLATLRERAEELALRRSLGATKRDIALLVLIEAVLIGVVGAVIAVGLTAVSFVPLISMLFPSGTTPQFPASAALIGIGVGAVAGVLGGLIPAVKAARMPIVAVMRA